MKGKKAEEPNNFSTQNTSRQKKKTTRKPRQKNPKSSITRLDNPGVDNSGSQITTTRTSRSFSAVPQETPAFNINNFLSTYSSSTAAEKKGACFFNLALIYSERAITPYAKSKDLLKCLSYCKKALRIEAFRTSDNGRTLIKNLSTTPEGLCILQSVGYLPGIPAQFLPTQTLPAQTSLNPYSVGKPTPLESPYHPLNNPMAFPTNLISTNPLQSRFSLSPLQVSFIPPSAISGFSHIATDNLGQFPQGISISPSLYQIPNPFLPSSTSGFPPVPIISSSTTSANSQMGQQNPYNINAASQNSQEKRLQQLSERLEQLKKN